MELNLRWHLPRYALDDLKVVRREHTGVGRYTTFDGPPIADISHEGFGIGHIEMQGLEHGLSKMLSIRQSRIDDLELVTTDPEHWDGVERPWKLSLPKPLKWKELQDDRTQCPEDTLGKSGLTSLEKSALVIMTRLFLPGVSVEHLKVARREVTSIGRCTRLIDTSNQDVPNGSLTWGEIELDGIQLRLGVRLEMKNRRLASISFLNAEDQQWNGTEGYWSFVTTWPMPPPLLRLD